MKKFLGLISLVLVSIFLFACTTNTTANGQVKLATQKVNNSLDGIIAEVKKLKEIDLDKIQISNLLEGYSMDDYYANEYDNADSTVDENKLSPEESTANGQDNDYLTKNQNTNQSLRQDKGLNRFSRRYNRNNLSLEIKPTQNILVKNTNAETDAKISFQRNRFVNNTSNRNKNFNFIAKTNSNDYNQLYMTCNDCCQVSNEFCNIKKDLLDSCYEAKDLINTLKNSNVTLSESELKTLNSYQEVLRQCLSNLKSCKNCDKATSTINSKKTNLATNCSSLNADYLRVYNCMDSNCTSCNNTNNSVNELISFVKKLLDNSSISTSSNYIEPSYQNSDSNAIQNEQTSNSKNPYVRNNRYLSRVNRRKNSNENSDNKQYLNENNGFLQNNNLPQNDLENRRNYTNESTTSDFSTKYQNQVQQQQSSRVQKNEDQIGYDQENSANDNLYRTNIKRRNRFNRNRRFNRTDQNNATETKSSSLETQYNNQTTQNREKQDATALKSEEYYDNQNKNEIARHNHQISDVSTNNITHENKPENSNQLEPAQQSYEKNDDINSKNDKTYNTMKVEKPLLNRESDRNNENDFLTNHTERSTTSILSPNDNANNNEIYDNKSDFVKANNNHNELTNSATAQLNDNTSHSESTNNKSLANKADSVNEENKMKNLTNNQSENKEKFSSTDIDEKTQSSVNRSTNKQNVYQQNQRKNYINRNRAKDHSAINSTQNVTDHTMKNRQTNMDYANGLPQDKNHTQMEQNNRSTNEQVNNNSEITSGSMTNQYNDAFENKRQQDLSSETETSNGDSTNKTPENQTTSNENTTNNSNLNSIESKNNISNQTNKFMNNNSEINYNNDNQNETKNNEERQFNSSNQNINHINNQLDSPSTQNQKAKEVESLNYSTEYVSNIDSNKINNPNKDTVNSPSISNQKLSDNMTSQDYTTTQQGTQQNQNCCYFGPKTVRAKIAV